MQNKNVIVGYICYYKEDMIPSKIDVVYDLCDRINTIAKCNYYFRISDVNSHTRKKMYSRKNISSEMESAIRNKYTYLFIEGPYVVSAIEKDRVLEASMILYDYWKIGKPLSFECTVLLPNIKEPVEILYKWIADKLKCQYGLIYLSDDYNYMLAELEAIPRSMWRDASEDTNRWREELGFYCKSDDKYNEYIRKAYWGNILNADHVLKLGGIERVKEEAPAYSVELMEGGGAYIQLTESPYDYYKPDYKERLQTLDKYFIPIILPGRPEVNWNYYDKKRL